MTVQQEEVALIIALIGAIIAIIPSASSFAGAWFLYQKNKLKIDHLPTHSDVQQAIDNKISELASNGSVVKDTNSSGTVPTESGQSGTMGSH